MLLPANEEQAYAPWAVTGFDYTTERRLRLPFPLMEELFSNAEQARFVSAEEDQRRMRPYVSNRELTSEAPLAIFRMGALPRPAALLVVAASPYLERAADILRVIVSAVNEPITALLEEHRNRRLATVRNRAVFTGHELRDAPDTVLAEQKQPLAVIEIDSGPLLRAVHEQFAEADRFRVKQDLTRIVAAVVAELGIVVDLPNDLLLAFLSNAEGVDLELLERHIEAVAHRVFLDSSGTFTLPMNARKQGNESVGEFVRASL